MTYMILALCAAAATLMMLYGLVGDIDHDEHEETRSRRRCLAELNEIELHRPHHIIR